MQYTCNTTIISKSVKPQEKKYFGDSLFIISHLPCLRLIQLINVINSHISNTIYSRYSMRLSRIQAWFKVLRDSLSGCQTNCSLKSLLKGICGYDYGPFQLMRAIFVTGHKNNPYVQKKHIKQHLCPAWVYNFWLSLEPLQSTGENAREAKSFEWVMCLHSY